VSLFGFREKKKIKTLEKRIKNLEELCETKDSFFTEMISDGLRKGSSLAGKHMADRKKWLRGK
ncbi:MAG: hypothetical protein IJI59_16655, partial [Clostridia bacterium]|nr:hypothetical protein [Clostridia bacterium]